jgi:hypothetical protein
VNAREMRMTPAQLAAEQGRQAAARRARSSRVKGKRGLAPGVDKNARRVEGRIRTSVLRGLVRDRMAGKSEISGDEVGLAWHMHHVEGGGSRLPKQRPGNVLGITYEEHRLAHRGDLETLRKIAAAPTLDAEARRAAERRIAKVLEARSVPSVPVRIEVQS